MPLNAVKSGYAFTRNPIIIRETFPSDAFNKNGGRFSLTLHGEIIFNGRFFPPLDIDISEILDACSSFFPEPPENNSAPLIEIEDAGEIGNRICFAQFEYDSYESELSFTAIPGGISQQNYKRYLTLEKDPFSDRFLNPECNFFLTTRTSGWKLVIKETELFPLYFMAEPSYGSISVVEPVNRCSINFDNIDFGVYALDLHALRRDFAENYNVLPNIFDIYAGDKHSCRIVIERAEIAKERYRVKFRNSLGVFEIIEFSGELKVTPEYSDADDAVFKKYDSFSGYFHSDRGKIERKQIITIETGTKRPDEIRFLMDMIGSEEVYLLGFSREPVRVIPNIDEFSYSNIQNSPQSFSINFTVSESETNILPDISDGSDCKKPRIFSSQFSNKFH